MEVPAPPIENSYSISQPTALKGEGSLGGQEEIQSSEDSDSGQRDLIDHIEENNSKKSEPLLSSHQQGSSLGGTYDPDLGKKTVTGLPSEIDNTGIGNKSRSGSVEDDEFQSKIHSPSLLERVTGLRKKEKEPVLTVAPALTNHAKNRGEDLTYTSDSASLLYEEVDTSEHLIKSERVGDNSEESASVDEDFSLPNAHSESPAPSLLESSGTDSKIEGVEEEEDLLDIPAFLRRQAD